MKKHILVTGVSSGIGYDTARELIAAGCHVLGSVRKTEDGERVAAALGADFTPLHFDVTDSAAIAAAVTEVETLVDGRGLAGLVNNAGVAPSGPLMHAPLAGFRETLEINVTGLLAVTQAFLPLLGARKGSATPPGRIVNLSSISGAISVPMLGAYAASKHAVEALSDGLRRELSIYGIHVAAIEPGAIRTPIWEKAAVDLARGPYDDTDYAPAMAALREMSVREAKSGKSVTTVSAAVRHALLSPRPKARYPLDPTWRLRNIIPTRVLDSILLGKTSLQPR